jgi:predicted MFS family arabinose efflux permease
MNLHRKPTHTSAGTTRLISFLGPAQPAVAAQQLSLASLEPVRHARTMHPASRPHAARLLAPFALAYAFSYALRTINAAIAPELRHSLGLSEAALGSLTAAYMAAFALAQLPVGIAMDHLGPRRVNAALLLVAVTGCVLFAIGQDATTLAIARAMIGGGVGGCLMTAIKANTQWFSQRQLPAMNSWVHVWGLVGAILSTLPATWLVGQIGVSGLFLLAAGIGLVASLWLWWGTPEAPLSAPEGGWVESLRDTLALFGQHRFWSLAFVASLAMGTHMAMQGLWLGQWLREALRLPEATVAHTLFAMMCAGAVGALSWGQIASRLARRGVTPLQVYAVACSLHLFTMTAMALAPTLVGTLPLVLAYAFTGMGGSLCYAVLTGRFEMTLTGRVNTALNLLIFIVAFAVQAGTGYLLHTLRDAGLNNAQAYTALLLGMVAYIALPLGWALRSAPRPPHLSTG